MSGCLRPRLRPRRPRGFAHGGSCRRAVWLATVLWLAVSCAWAADFPKFEFHPIDKIGNMMGQTSLVDVDKDGDLDWIAGSRRGDVWWFEYQGPDRWVRHKIGGRADTEVGGTAFDVDGDGWVDQVSGGCWYRNPGSPAGKEFTRYDNGALYCHDDVAADVDGDGKLDLVAMQDTKGVYWYRIPADPTRRWEEHRVGPAVHGGIAPRGVGDLDGDGDNDIVRSTGWYENADGKGTDWRWHANIEGGHSGRFKDTTKSWIVDLDKDGDNDVVLCDADLEAGAGRVHWFENKDGRGGAWTRHEIASKKGDLHTLAVADFDGDGDPDVFSGEGPLGGSGPGGKHRWFVWQNADGRGGKWVQRVIHEGSRCHEGVAADVDGDGDVDICSKPWNGNLHVYLRNRLVEDRGRPGAGPDRLPRRPQPHRVPVTVHGLKPSKAGREKGDKSNLPRSGPEGASHKLDLSQSCSARDLRISRYPSQVVLRGSTRRG